MLLLRPTVLLVLLLTVYRTLSLTCADKPFAEVRHPFSYWIDFEKRQS